MKSSASRKSLIVAVFSVLAVVVMVNAFNQFRTVQEATSQNQPRPEEQKNLTKQDVSEQQREGLAASIKTTLPGSKGDGPEPANMAEGASSSADFVNPEEPTVLVTRMRVPKQQPNDSATSSQWYNEDARLKEKAAQMDKQNAVGSGG